jgi:twitching motility protein PilT
MEEKLHEILRTALKFKASDVHLKVGVPPIVRVDGKLHPLKKVSRLDPMDLETFADVMTNSAQKKRLKEFHELDLGYGVSGLGRFRVNIYSQRGTLVIAMRVITSEILDFKALNMPPVVEKMIAEQRRGLILVTGVTGSGKTTTLAAMIDYINRHRSENIITIEDPIEYLHTDRLSLINQREVGFDTTSFSLALRAALRQDPDVLLVGEMRDLETIEIALTAAETGHLVLSTLHTNDTISAISRLTGLGIEPSLITSTLIGVVSQRLARRICPNCRESYQPKTSLLNEFFATPPGDIDWVRGRGCRQCNYTGYKGRLPLAELWEPSPNDILLINKQAPLEQLRQSARATSISIMEEARLKLQNGETTMDELIRVLPYFFIAEFRNRQSA